MGELTWRVAQPPSDRSHATMNDAQAREKVIGLFSRELQSLLQSSIRQLSWCSLSQPRSSPMLEFLPTLTVNTPSNGLPRDWLKHPSQSARPSVLRLRMCSHQRRIEADYFQQIC